MQRGAHVVLNGELLRREAARLEVDDAGFLLGDGVFETLRVYDGVPFLIDRHLERLEAALRWVDIRIPWSRDDLLALVRRLLEANESVEGSARLRLTVSRGPSAASALGSGAGTPTLLITADPYEPPAALDHDRGVEVAISPRARRPGPWHFVKSTSRQPNLLLRREAAAQGAFEMLEWNDAGRLTEGSFTNVFVVDADGVLRTPLPEEGCLRGVTRGAVLDLATASGCGVREGDIDPACLREAREVFLTGSLVEIVPVRAVGGRAVGATPAADPRAGAAGASCPGPMTAELRRAYAALVVSAISAAGGAPRGGLGPRERVEAAGAGARISARRSPRRLGRR